MFSSAGAQLQKTVRDFLLLTYRNLDIWYCTFITQTLYCCQKATVWKIDTLYLLVSMLSNVCPYSTTASHSVRHNVREDRLNCIRESEPEFPIGWIKSQPEVHLAGPLLGDQQPREINKAVNTNCQGDGLQGELIFHSP